MRASTVARSLGVVLGLGALLGCASTGPKTDMGDIPDWYLSPPTDDSYIFAPATSTSRDMQMAVNKAKAQAQTAIAGQLETKLGNLTKQFQEEVGSGEDSELLEQFTSATKIVVQQTLNGARVDQQKLLTEKGIYRAYVLMSLPVGAANQALMEKIKANQNLYTRFRASQAFEELNKELEAYKAEQQAQQ
ncbi:MAG: hypothetical protein AB1505_20120 [Candidatus Latescibacterota bacterium]